MTFDDALYDATTSEWVREVDPPRTPAPSLLEAHQAFSDILAVSQDKQTGYITVSVEHQSPSVAAQWIDWLVKDANEAVRAQDVDDGLGLTGNVEIDELKRCHGEVNAAVWEFGGSLVARQFARQ